MVLPDEVWETLAGRVRSCPVTLNRVGGWLGVSEAKAVAQMHRVLAVVYAVPGVGWASSR